MHWTQGYYIISPCDVGYTPNDLINSLYLQEFNSLLCMESHILIRTSKDATRDCILLNSRIFSAMLSNEYKNTTYYSLAEIINISPGSLRYAPVLLAFRSCQIIFSSRLFWLELRAANEIPACRNSLAWLIIKHKWVSPQCHIFDFRRLYPAFNRCLNLFKTSMFSNLQWTDSHPGCLKTTLYILRLERLQRLVYDSTKL